MNYYEHHLGDYAQATQHLTFVEDAAYSRMLRKYYAEEKPLPADLRSVQRLVGARTDEEREAVEVILGEFFTLESDGWHNGRADAEIAKVREKREKASRSAKSRWNANASGTDANASKDDANASKHDAKAMLGDESSHDERNALQAPSSKHQTTEKDQKQKRAAAAAADLFAGVDSGVVSDFIALRAKHRAPVTETAVAGLRREAEAAGYSLEQALRTCCERGWRGFKAEWVARDGAGNVRQFPSRPAAKPGSQPDVLPELTA